MLLSYVLLTLAVAPGLSASSSLAIKKTQVRPTLDAARTHIHGERVAIETALALRGGAAAQPSAPKATDDRKAMVTAVVGIVGMWLGVATYYYATHEGWPYAQAFFYAVDTGMSIGFGTVAEQRPSTKLFTIFHVLLGASAVGGAIALFAESAISGVASVSGSEYARASVRAAFMRADSDGSGSLSVREFRDVLKRCGLDLSAEEAATTMAVFDEDSSGSIEIGEFLSAIEPHVDSNTPVSAAIKTIIKDRADHPLVRAAKHALELLAEHRVIALWVLWIGGGALWGMLTEGWGPIASTYFAVGALATGGLEGPSLTAAGTIPDKSALFVGLYCLTGIPIFAMALGQFANSLIERHVAARERRALSKSISEDEFEFAQQLVSNDGKIDLSEFIVLELFRLGKLDGATISTIKAEFQRLDKNGDGTLKRSEVLEATCSA